MAEKGELVFAVLHLGRNGMEVVSEREGKRRRVSVTWPHQTSDLPPDGWEQQVKGELDFQDSSPNSGDGV